LGPSQKVGGAKSYNFMGIFTVFRTFTEIIIGLEKKGLCQKVAVTKNGRVQKVGVVERWKESKSRCVCVVLHYLNESSFFIGKCAQAPYRVRVLIYFFNSFIFLAFCGWGKFVYFVDFLKDGRKWRRLVFFLFYFYGGFKSTRSLHFLRDFFVIL
jgi:hypothetical protein